MKKNKFTAFAAALCLAVQMMPAAALSAEVTGSAEFIYGDVSEDTKVDISDLSLISLHLINDITLTGNPLKAADTNGDGTVTLADLAHLRRFLSKYAVKLGPQTEVNLKLRPASDYAEISEMAEISAEKDYYYADMDYAINAVPDAVPTASPSRAPGSISAPTTGSSDDSHSETYSQEENVLEADIVKTDGSAVFSLCDSANLKVVYVSDGKFTAKQNTKNLTKDFSIGTLRNISAKDMYLYNDRIIILGKAELPYSSDDNSVPSWYFQYGITRPYTFVSVLTKGDSENAPELIDTYFQEGSYNDVRITPDGFMYLVSNGRYAESDDEKTDKKVNYTQFIPAAGPSGSVSAVPCGCIYIPEIIDETCSRLYTVIGGIDLNTADGIKNPEVKVISGYSGEIYCSEKNLYLTHSKYNDKFRTSEFKDGERLFTEITRVSLSKGKITPEATGMVPGYIHNQFSMSEYRDYFRIATTSEYSVSGKFNTKKSNNVFVLDQNLEKAGEITHFAENESVKSVSFAGDIGYVVTYVQTDPLFAIDLSDPSNPVILDEFKIDGFSTYMQKWDDSHLLGFGVSTYTNEYGGEVRDGFKLVMFNNSDPENLSAEGIFKVLDDDPKFLDYIDITELSENERRFSYLYFYSNAEYERKELLIAPEKNLIGFPIVIDAISDYSENYSKYSGTGYLLFSYDNGEFTFKNFLGDITDTRDIERNYYWNFERAVYIGDYVYIVSKTKLISADIETGTKADETVFY